MSLPSQGWLERPCPRRSWAMQRKPRCAKEQHLVFPGIRAQRPTMAEDHRLARAPVLVVRSAFRRPWSQSSSLLLFASVPSYSQPEAAVMGVHRPGHPGGRQAPQAGPRVPCAIQDARDAGALGRPAPGSVHAACPVRPGCGSSSYSGACRSNRQVVPKSVRKFSFPSRASSWMSCKLRWGAR